MTDLLRPGLDPPAPPRLLPRRPPTPPAPVGGGRALWVWCAGLAVCLWVLHVGIAGRLPQPPLAPSRWAGWIDEVGGATAVVSVLRLVAAAIGWYLLVVTVAGLVLRWRDSPQVLAVDRVTPSVVRRVLDHPNGIVAATVLGIVVAPLALPRPTSSRDVIAVPVTTPTAVASASSAPLAVSGGPVTPDGPFLPDIAAFDLAPVALPPVDAEPEQTEPEQTGPSMIDHWLVEPGDHLWAIATAIVAERSPAGEPAEEAVASYWTELIEANRDRLVDPSNPDLIYPGQELLLP